MYNLLWMYKVVYCNTSFHFDCYNVHVDVSQPIRWKIKPKVNFSCDFSITGVYLIGAKDVPHRKNTVTFQK